MYPALAVARALRDARPELDLAYAGGARGLERRIVAADGTLPY
ncbi:MAG: undecaprenyldiphospho-muramoylpentapeptide beta-N-acetylglucosaminyltransferase, partial [Candidatus Limnocylindria bacterium]